MPAIRLSAQGIRDSVELEPIVVTATHSPKTLKDAPVVTRLITLHDIKLTDATNIQEMLTQEIPGLEFGLAMSQETSLNMSGFGGNAVLFLVDGERLAGETMDNTDYNRLNLDNVGRIEIVKGASSALYGSNAVGGVVNIISRENLEPWTANVNTRYNTFGHEWRNGASFSFNTQKWNSQTSFQHTKIDPVDLPKAHTAEEIALELLKKAIGDTSDKLNQLKAAQEQMKAEGVDQNSKAYQGLQREIASTEQSLKQLQDASKSLNDEMNKSVSISEKMAEATKKIADGAGTVAEKTKKVSLNRVRRRVSFMRFW